MAIMPYSKYRPASTVQLPDRTWPNRTIERAPAWCSIDLRDGNQALIEPMGKERKSEMFDLLVELGVKEIEVGFPSASQTDFDFLRFLVEQRRIPEDVTIQVLTQARPALIERTFEAIRGAPQAIVHLYNSTSALQRKVVFGMDRGEVRDLAVTATRRIRELAAGEDTNIRFEYSPESFTSTELDFSLEICEAVMDEWEPSPTSPIIVNLPATVEVSTPNIYADQIEWFDRKVKQRDSVVLSVHPHNDRGTAVAAAELALMAGAERVEGALFGNGERTGNVDLVTLALNLFTQGVDPGLDLSDIGRVVQVAEQCTRLPVHPRHPYAGELVYTAFSGSHQDAIRKGLLALGEHSDDRWEVPYLPIDPTDVGRTYEAIIRINSQSGKGGVAYILEEQGGFRLPRALQIEFSRQIQEKTDRSGEELPANRIVRAFTDEYLQFEPWKLLSHQCTRHNRTGSVELEATVVFNEGTRLIRGIGNGPIDAFADALGHTGTRLTVLDYNEHSTGHGAGAAAVAYVEVEVEGGIWFGAGRDPDIVSASLQALLSAINRASRGGTSQDSST